MNIHLSIPDEAEVEAIYEAYRIVAEPDSPVICYKDLNQADREKIVRGYQRFFRSANCDGQTVGWITIIDRESDPDVNLGFGLFPEFRGRGLMAQIIRHSMKEILPRLRDRKLTAGARVDNLAAIRTLEKAGFVLVGMTEQPPTGRWQSSIRYSRFMFIDNQGPSVRHNFS
ncbi:MAG: GNAT family N-acetyltransferase [Bdellovibrionales bacterium]|nr:GNAT family N-acetyltransferase [Bdellovibrionales bacterium]